MPPPHADNTTNTFDCWELPPTKMNFTEGFFFLFFLFLIFLDSFPRELARVGLVPWQDGFPADKLLKTAEEGRLREAESALPAKCQLWSKKEEKAGTLQGLWGKSGAKLPVSKTCPSRTGRWEELKLLVYKWERSYFMSHLSSKY